MLNLSHLPKEVISELDKFRSAYFATVKFAKAGMPSTPSEVLENRQSICKTCDQWDSQAINGTGRCKKCGCSTWAKLRMATERCPLGKWEAVIAEEKDK